MGSKIKVTQQTDRVTNLINAKIKKFLNRRAKIYP